MTFNFFSSPRKWTRYIVAGFFILVLVDFLSSPASQGFNLPGSDCSPCGGVCTGGKSG